MDFLENIDINIDEGILKNIDIDWNLAYRTGLLSCLFSKVKKTALYSDSLGASEKRWP